MRTNFEKKCSCRKLVLEVWIFNYKKASIVILIYAIDLKFRTKSLYDEKITTTNFVNNEETFTSARFLQTKGPKIRTTLLGDSWSIYYTLNISILS